MLCNNFVSLPQILKQECMCQGSLSTLAYALQVASESCLLD